MKSIWISLPYSDSSNIKKHLALIGIRDEINDLEIIHPISEFIIANWKNSQFNTQKKHAYNLISFLNYLRNQNIIENLKDLEVNHIVIFLNDSLMKGNKEGTVKSCEKTLIYFLIWLLEEGYTSSKSIKLLIKKLNNKSVNNKNIFNVMYTNKDINRIEHVLPFEYITLFIETAIFHSNPIALGIYFQIFGGLRVSEVLNIDKTQIARRVKKGDFSLKLETKNFRTDLSEHPSVKKERVQEVLNINNFGLELFYHHINNYRSDKTTALFINRDQNAMSEQSYRRYFNKVKKEFIKTLENSTDLNMNLAARSLKSTKWSTHVGRGTFTHLISEHSTNPIEIAHNRGDSNLDSAIPYFANTSRIYDSLRESFNYMHTDYMRNLLKDDKNREE